MRRAGWSRTVVLPLLVLGLQVGAAWLFVQTANGAWGAERTVDATAARHTTLWLFAAGGPLACLLLGWGLYAAYARRSLAAALANTLLFVPPLLVGGLTTWTLGVLLGWI